MIGAFAITAVTAISTSANAGENDIAVPAGKLNWAPFGETSAQMVVLWGDPASSEYAVLLKLPPGFTPGPHSHTFAYHGVNLQGTWTHIFGDDDVRSLPPAQISLRTWLTSSVDGILTTAWPFGERTRNSSPEPIQNFSTPLTGMARLESFMKKTTKS